MYFRCHSEGICVSRRGGIVVPFLDGKFQLSLQIRPDLGAILKEFRFQK